MASPKSAKTGYRWLRRSLIALVTLSLLYLGSAFALSRFLDPDELAAWLEPRLESALNREVNVGGVKVGLFPLAVRLQAVDVSDPTGLAEELAHIGSLELRVKILPLLRREIQVSRLVVDDFRADLRISKDGISNFGDFSTRPEAGDDREVADAGGSEAGEPFSLDLQGIRFQSGRLRYANERDSLALDLASLTLEAAARQDPEGNWAFVGSTGGVLTFQHQNRSPVLEGAPLELAFDVLADDGFEGLKIRTGELRLGEIQLALTGEIQGVQDPVRSASLSIEGAGLRLEDLLSVLPDTVKGRIPVQAQGLVQVVLRVEGDIGPGQLPAVTGNVNLMGGEITRDGARLAEDLTADIELAPENSIRIQAQATALDGPFSMEGTTTLGPEGVTNLAFRATPDLARIGSVVTLPDDVSAGGKVDVDVRVESPLQNFREARFRGNIQAMDIHGTHPGLAVPIGIPSGEVQLSGTKATVRDLPLLLGGDRVLISGELRDLFALLLPEQTPHFQGTLRGSRLNLPELSPRPRPDPNLSYGKVAFAKVGDRPVGGGSFRAAAEDLGLSRPENLPLGGSLDLALDTVIDNRGRMENLRAHVDFGPSFMEVTDASFKRFGGEIHTTLDLSLGSPDAAPFSFSLDVRELDAGGFLSGVTPLGETVRGTISMELDLIGTLDGFLLPDRPALVGSATFSLSDGGLKSTPLTQAISAILGMESLREPSIEDWTGSLVVEQGRILLANATIHGVPGNPEVGGRVGLNGELDLRSAFALPSDRLSTSALDRLGIAGDIAARVAQRPEVVQAVLRIGGSFANPAVEADPYAAARTLGQAVEEEVRAEAQARIDAEKARAAEALEEQRAEAQRRIQEQKNELRSRATGFLQDLMRPRDTSPPTSVAPDTLVSDTMQLDSLRPDTIRPDTATADSIRPDTLGVHTLRPDTIRPDTVRPDTTRPDTAWGRLSPGRLSGSPPPRPGRKPARAPGLR